MKDVGKQITMQNSRLNQYIAKYMARTNLGKWLNYYKNLPLKRAIKESAIAIGPNGKKHPHQRRIPKKILKKVARILVKNKGKINHCNSFEDLINLVYQKVKKVKGFGELCVYDTALRIGASKNIYPEKMVYIHAGTDVGCKNLKLKNSNYKVWKVLPVDNNLPKPLRKLKAYEIEDFLCIYKSEIND